jgi:hypothetical protein
MPGDAGYKPFQPGVTTPQPEFEISEETGLSDGVAADSGADGERAAPEGAAAGQPAELGEEYKPYSQFPWERLPPEVREEFLGQVKKFHGDMSRNQTELGELRKQSADLRQKAEWFDQLAGQKWFMDAYLRQQQGGGAPAPDAAAERGKLERLAEYGIDANATTILKSAMEEQVEGRIAPLKQQLEYLQRSLMDRAARDELAEVRKFATEKGLPSPDDIVPKLTQLIQTGEAKSIWGAYRIATFDEAQAAAEKRAKTTLTDDLRRKSEATLSPYAGPAIAPADEQYTGRDGVLRALRSAVAEQRQSGLRR